MTLIIGKERYQLADCEEAFDVVGVVFAARQKRILHAKQKAFALKPWVFAAVELALMSLIR